MCFIMAPEPYLILKLFLKSLRKSDAVMYSFRDVMLVKLNITGIIFVIIF